jgi:hypothetical protein
MAAPVGAGKARLEVFPQWGDLRATTGPLPEMRPKRYKVAWLQSYVLCNGTRDDGNDQAGGVKMKSDLLRFGQFYSNFGFPGLPPIRFAMATSALAKRGLRSPERFAPTGAGGRADAGG